MRVLVTGSRDLTDVDLVHDALSELWEQRFDELGDLEFVVVHGGARGADTMAGDWCRLMRRHGVREDAHHADWKTHGRAAGMIRNREMVETKPDIVLAFYRATSENVGTKGCVALARKARIPVLEHTQN